jgi:hypothetical protein
MPHALDMGEIDARAHGRLSYDLRTKSLIFKGTMQKQAVLEQSDQKRSRKMSISKSCSLGTAPIRNNLCLPNTARQIFNNAHRPKIG